MPKVNGISEKAPSGGNTSWPLTRIHSGRSAKDAGSGEGSCPTSWALGPRVLQREVPGDGGKHIRAGCLGALKLCSERETTSWGQTACVPEGGSEK